MIILCASLYTQKNERNLVKTKVQSIDRRTLLCKFLIFSYIQSKWAKIDVILGQIWSLDTEGLISTFHTLINFVCLFIYSLIFVQNTSLKTALVRLSHTRDEKKYVVTPQRVAYQLIKEEKRPRSKQNSKILF